MDLSNVEIIFKIGLSYTKRFFALGFDLENLFTVQQKIEREKRKDSWIYSLG